MAIVITAIIVTSAGATGVEIAAVAAAVTAGAAAAAEIAGRAVEIAEGPEHPEAADKHRMNKRIEITRK